jgi:KDO2-lipid IV(A) lauroyltransferase
VGLENLRLALPERADHGRILKESLRLQAVALLDALWSARLTPARAAALVSYDPEAWRRVESVFRAGRGAVVATAHFGSWEMFNLAAGALGLPKATFVARPIPNPWIDRHLRRRRERTGNRLVYRAEALPACIAALRRGEVACSVIDIAVLPSEGGLFVDFLGTPAATSGVLPLLAVRREAPLIFAVCRPLERGRRYRLEGEEIGVRRDAPDRDAEVRRVTQELSNALARRVREHPEAWIWGYKRWKWRPSELPGGYPDYSLWVHPMW